MNPSQLFSVGNMRDTAPCNPVEVPTNSPRVYAQHYPEEGVDVVQIIPRISKDDLKLLGGILASQYSDSLAEPGVTTTAVPDVDVNNIGFISNTGGLARIAVAVKVFVDDLS